MSASEAIVEVPQDCLQLVMAHCVRIIKVVITPTENDQLPTYVDTVADWKEFCSSSKSAIKFILAEAASSSPALALEIVVQVAVEVTPYVQAVQRDAGEGIVTTAVNKLDVCTSSCFR
jgi:hypothetical protein